MKREGLTKLGKRAQEAQPTEIQEKPEHLAKITGFEIKAESQAEYEERVSEDLLKKVKEIFGQPYIPRKRRKMSIIHPKVMEIVSECLKVDKDKLSRATDFEKDLNVCYIDQRVLRRMINKEFNVKISFESHQKINTIGDLIDTVEYTKEFDAYKAKKLKREFRKEIKPFMFIWIIIALVILGMFIWELAIKRFFIK